MGGGDGGASRKLKKAAKKIFVHTCGSSCHGQEDRLDNSPAATTSECSDSPIYSSFPPENQMRNFDCKKMMSKFTNPSNNSPNKNLCTICLDPLNYSSGGSQGQAIFTAQCSHAFHFACISSNVRHGSITCPVCRAHWTQLPRHLTVPFSLPSSETDPALRILDDSIATSRIHRRSFLRSARYNDDDPIEPEPEPITPAARLCFALFSSSPLSGRAYLRVGLAAARPTTDLVLVASPSGPRLRLMKQAMASVVSSLRPADRLAIVSCSLAAARVFPLRRMTPSGKQAALRVVKWMFRVGPLGPADPAEGLGKGAKVLEDRVHRNAQSCILHLTDAPWQARATEHPVEIYHFDVGRGLMREFEELLERMLGGVVRDVRVRVENGAGTVRIGELRGGEERNVMVCSRGCGPVRVEYSYVEEECVRTGEVVVGLEEKCDGSLSGGGDGEGRLSSVESWDYHDPFMARRWAKHLHGYRF